MRERPERRGAPRVAVRLEVSYEDAQRQLFLPSRDLSESGIFLLCADPPRPGRRAQLLFELPGEPELVRLGGVVVRLGASASEGFAVHFDRVSVSESAHGALRRSVSRIAIAGTG
jgi:hypothetical protein